jgi:hypothetical protein
MIGIGYSQNNNIDRSFQREIEKMKELCRTGKRLAVVGRVDICEQLGYGRPTPNNNKSTINPSGAFYKRYGDLNEFFCGGFYRYLPKAAAIIYAHYDERTGEIDEAGMIRDLVMTDDPKLGACTYPLFTACGEYYYATTLPAAKRNAGLCMAIKNMMYRWGELHPHPSRGESMLVLDKTKIGLDFRVVASYLMGACTIAGWKDTVVYAQGEEIKIEKRCIDSWRNYWGRESINDDGTPGKGCKWDKSQSAWKCEEFKEDLPPPGADYMCLIANELMSPQNSPGYPVLLKYADPKTSKIDSKGLADYLVDKKDPRLALEVLDLLEQMRGHAMDLRVGATWRGDKFAGIKVSVGVNPFEFLRYIDDINFLREVDKEFEELEKYDVTTANHLRSLNYSRGEVARRINFLERKEKIENSKEWSVINKYIDQNGKMNCKGLTEEIVRSDEDSAIKLLFMLSEIDNLRIRAFINWGNSNISIGNITITDPVRRAGMAISRV